MIYIKRTEPIPQSIIDNASQEHLAAELFYQKKRKKFISFNHKVYKSSDVKLALIKEFNGKCAYCESYVIATSAIDKEHFRPKGSIIDEKNKTNIKPGYYWLAADWNNLLLACPNCNRTGTFTDNNLNEFVAGKLDHFPISKESKRYVKGGDFDAEEEVRLLINPCVDKPETWFVYNEEGFIFPNKTLKGHIKNKVETSIKVYGLSRSELNKKRKEKYLELQDILSHLSNYYEDYLSSHGSKKYLDRIKKCFVRIKNIKASDQEYLGMKRYIIRQELNKLKEIISHMKNPL